MNTFSIVAAGFTLLLVGCGACFSLQLLRQNGRLLLRLEELEEQLDKFEVGDLEEPARELAVGAEALPAPANGSARPQSLSHPMGEGGPGPSEGDRVNRFRDRSLARRKLKRDGLKAGAPAPESRLPRLNGTELSLTELRGRAVLLVFSDPHCGPCNPLAPKLEKFHRGHPELRVVMISRGDLDENRA